MSEKEHKRQVEYWRNRETVQRRKYIRDEERYQKEIERIYLNMMDEIQKEINGFYVRYAKKEGITIAEAKKRASKLDMEEYSRKAAKYVKEKNFSDAANEEMRLYNMTMKVNRLEMLKARMGLELVSGFDELQKFFDEKLTDRTLEEFERQAGILGKSVLQNEKKAHAIVNASFHNAKFSDRIWMYQDMMKAELSKLLQQGLIRGKHPRDLARHLKKLFGVSQYNAERLMIAELARVQSEAQKQSFERNGFEYYEYIACGKGDVCNVCKALDGRHFKVKEMMPGENAPPMHPLCHCSIAAWEDNEEYEEWLDFLDKGGTTAEWKKLKKKGNAIAKQDDSAIIDSQRAKEVADVHTVGRINKEIYKCITDDIITDEVIITDNQIQHIKDRHPNDYERFSSYFAEIVASPDYIIEANKPSTALVLKEIKMAQEVFKTVVRLATPQDNPKYKNSIITFMKIDEKEWKRLLRNKKILYRKE